MCSQKTFENLFGLSANILFSDRFREKSRRFEFLVTEFLPKKSVMPAGADDPTNPLSLVAARSTSWNYMTFRRSDAEIIVLLAIDAHLCVDSMWQNGNDGKNRARKLCSKNKITFPRSFNGVNEAFTVKPISQIAMIEIAVFFSYLNEAVGYCLSNISPCNTLLSFSSEQNRVNSLGKLSFKECSALNTKFEYFLQRLRDCKMAIKIYSAFYVDL